ncbi:MAG: type II toxin-antitoxin system VapC family toxin [Bryobacteraceae bacterium]
MIVLDVNILLYAYDSDSPHHAAAKPWIERTLSSGDPVGLPWQTIAAFLRISTNARAMNRRLLLEEAVEAVDEWLQQPNVRVLEPTEDHWVVLRQMVTEGQTTGPLVTDAELAAITVEYGGVIYTTDRDFARFPGLRWKNPLA